MKAKRSEEIRQVICELVVIKAKLMRVGLIRTSHKVDEATKIVGYEWADLITGKQKDIIMYGEG